MKPSVIGLLLLCLSALSSAEEALVVLESTVVGNQEQPKVLYLLPWQSAAMPEQLFQPFETLVGNLYQPIEREQFLRELRFRQENLRADQPLADTAN